MLSTINKAAAFEATVFKPTRRMQTQKIVRKILVFCGILSSLLYVAMNIFVPMLFPGYSSASQTVSELSAIDAPTRPVWVMLAIVYAFLLVAFGWGIRASAGQKRSLRTAGTLIIVYALVGLAWPPMHQREVLAAGGGSLTDTLHIAFTMVAVILMLVIIGFSAASMGQGFFLYSIATIAIMLFFGSITGLQSPRLEANLSTPLMGVWERISIGSFMLWVVVLSILLLRGSKGNAAKFFVVLAMVAVPQLVFSQNVAINADGSLPDKNAMLDIKSGNKGLLIPRMSTAARLKIPNTQGLLVYDTNTNSFWYNTGRSWQNMSNTLLDPSGAWLLAGNAGTVDNVNFLGTLDNVALNFRVNNQSSGRIDPVQFNTFFGFRSGYSVTTGNDNTGIGSSALFSITTGFNNTAVGSNALQTNSTGFHNTALGRFALMSNTTGYNNTAGGVSSLFSNISGINNTANGSNTLRTNSTGYNNTAIGAESMYNNSIGNNNTAVGVGSLHFNTTGGDNSGFGVGALGQNTTGFGNSTLGIGSLTSNTSGRYNTASGHSALARNTQGNNNAAFGARALFTNTGSDNTAVGTEAMYYSTTGTLNTAVGAYSLYSNTIAPLNTAVGYQSMYLNTSGFANTATGARALYSNTIGEYNTAVGNNALYKNVSSDLNVAIGNDALYNNTGNWNSATGAGALYSNTIGVQNSAHGWSALNFNVSGTGNTAAGAFALRLNTSGIENAAVGIGALSFNVSGNFNTAIGSRANVAGGDLINATAIGSTTTVDASNKVRIGNAAVTVIEGQVPFTTPSDGRFKTDVRNDVKGLDFILQLHPVTYLFDTKRFDAQYLADSNMNASYESASAIRRSGFIAQEVEQAATRSGYNFSGIIIPNNQQRHYSLSYEAFVVPLVKAVQEQQQTIEAQEKTLQEQNKKIANLQQQLNEIKAALKMPK